MQDAEKKERPQDKNLTSFANMDTEKARAIQSAGGKARQKQIQKEKTKKELFCALLSLGIDSSKGKPVGLDKLKSLDEAEVKNISVLAAIIIREYKHYIETGDKESRDWIMNNAFPEEPQPVQESDSVSAEMQTDGAIRIHLIRGEKPRKEPTPDDGASHA